MKNRKLNLLETEDGSIIGIDSQTPFPPPPWKYQSPAIKFWNMSSSRENLLVTDSYSFFYTQ